MGSSMLAKPTCLPVWALEAVPKLDPRSRPARTQGTILADRFGRHRWSFHSMVRLTTCMAMARTAMAQIQSP
eukprot:g7171.t1